MLGCPQGWKSVGTCPTEEDCCISQTCLHDSTLNKKEYQYYEKCEDLQSSAVWDCYYNGGLCSNAECC